MMKVTGMNEAQRNERPNERIVRLRLLHYGASQYDPNKFAPISDVPFRNKPKGGLWTSPVASKYGWIDWWEENEFGELGSFFEIEFTGTVFVIDSVNDMNKLPWIDLDGHSFISFQAMCAIGFTYDAIHLTEKGQMDTRFTHPRSLYGWDCETVLVMNPDSIQAI